MRRSDHWTILIVPARGGATRPLRVPGWIARATRTCMALAFCAVVFVGWQLQARFGLLGPHVTELGGLDFGADRFGLFMNVAWSRPSPTPDELRRRAAIQRAQKLGLGDRRAASSLLLGMVEPAWRQEAERVRPGDGTLLWPVRSGWYGRGYGSGSGGYHLAVDINADRGTDVLAAAPGIVGYAGRELRGFGNAVLIIHPGGWVTLYAHNASNAVIAGQRVVQGQPIAALGSTGRSMGPHLHFELMHDGRNCDPMPIVRPGPDSYRNYVPAMDPLAWRPGTARPEAVRCKRRMAHPSHADDDEGGHEVDAHAAARSGDGAATARADAPAAAGLDGIQL